MEQLPSSRTMTVSASRTSRVLAFVVDIFIVNLVILWPMQSFLPDITLATLASDSVTQAARLSFFAAVSGLALLLYFALCESHAQATIGMLLFGIRAEVATFWAACVRNVFVIPIFPLSLLWIIDLYYFIRYGERWLERITKTRTVQTIEI